MSTAPFFFCRPGPLAAACLLVIAGSLAWQVLGWQEAIRRTDLALHEVGSVALPRQNTPPVFFENDSYAWLTYARSIASGEGWRVHYTMADNAPYGRPVHWSNSVSWLLVVAAWIVHACCGRPLVQSIEAVSVWLNPCLLWLLAFWLGREMWRSLGAVTAILGTFFFLTAGYTQWAFHSLRPDHQGLQVVFVALSLLGVAFAGGGWVRSPAIQSASFGGAGFARMREDRRLFLLSGLATGAGFWISAAVQEIALVILVITASLAIVFLVRRGDTDYRPGLWRLWGWAGALASLGFYLLEYFPMPAMRLEVNNPIYSVSIWGAGQFLAALAEGRVGSAGKAFSIRCVGLILALLPLGLVLLGPPAWHAMRDPMMQRFHEGIAEFQGLGTHSTGEILVNLFGNLGILPIFLVAALFLVSRCHLRDEQMALLWFTFAFSYAFLFLSYFQVRWTAYLALMNAVLAAVTCRILWARFSERPVPGRRVCLAVIFILAIQPLVLGWRAVSYPWEIAAGARQSELLVGRLINCRLISRLGALELPPRAALMSPDLAPLMYYATGIRGVSSYYWENAEGLAAATGILNSTEPAKAIELTKRKIALICLTPGDAVRAFYVEHGAKPSAGEEERTFGGRIVENIDFFPGIDSATDLRKTGAQTYEFHGAIYRTAVSIRKVAGW